MVAMILKFCDGNGYLVSFECSCIAEKGEDTNGRSVLTDIDLHYIFYWSSYSYWD